MRQRLGIERQLIHQRLVGGAFDAGLGHHQAGGGGNDQGGHLRHQAITHRQQREGLGGVGETHAFLRHGDDDAADDVDADDHQAGDGIAAHEFAGAVHGAEEIGFRFDILAAALGFLFVDQAGGKVGVDRHLLAGHRVQAEARRHFGDAARALGDDHEIDDDQDREHDQADHEIALHDQLAEGLNDIAGSGGAFIAVAQDQAGRSQVQRQPHHGGEQQDGGKGAEFQRLADEHRRHQDQDRKAQRKSQADIEQPGRQRQNQDHQDRHDADGEAEFASFDDAHQLAGGEVEPRCGCCGADISHLDQPANRFSP